MSVNVSDEFARRVFDMMVQADRHIFQVLTKRPNRMCSYLSDPTLFERIQCHATAYRERYPQVRDVKIADPCRFPAKWLWWGTSAETPATLLERS